MSTDRGEGPVALLLHGQPGQGSDWDDVAAGLASSNRVLVPDRPGYGRTGGPAVGLAANADSLDCLLDDKGVGSATVVGHSLRDPQRRGVHALPRELPGEAERERVHLGDEHQEAAE